MYLGLFGGDFGERQGEATRDTLAEARGDTRADDLKLKNYIFRSEESIADDFGHLYT